MTPTVTVTAAGEIATATYGAVTPNAAPTWSDDFTGTTVDRAKWNVRQEAEGGTRQGYCLPANVTVQPDGLHITTKRESYGGKPYTTGSIDSNGKFSFSTGLVEVDAKLPTAEGLWPAIWLRNASVGEIDIMEAIGGLPHMIVQTVHENTAGDPYDRCGFDYEDASFAPGQFHTYGVRRDADGTVSFFVDRKLTVVHKPTDISNHFHKPMGWLAGPGYAAPFYLRINTQAGGAMPHYYGHDIGPATALPDDFVIRSVRYYR